MSKTEINDINTSFYNFKNPDEYEYKINKGLTKEIVEIFIKMIKREKLLQHEKELLKDGAIFENISNMPARVKCVLLSWHTLENMLNELENAQKKENN